MNQRHVHLKYLHPFWTPVYSTIPPNERIGGKLGVARALKGYLVGYSYSKFLQPCYKVVARYSNGTFGRVRHTKDERDGLPKHTLGPQALLQMDQRQAPVCHSSQG